MKSLLVGLTLIGLSTSTAFAFKKPVEPSKGKAEVVKEAIEKARLDSKVTGEVAEGKRENKFIPVLTKYSRPNGTLDKGALVKSLKDIAPVLSIRKASILESVLKTNLEIPSIAKAVADAIAMVELSLNKESMTPIERAFTEAFAFDLLSTVIKKDLTNVNWGDSSNVGTLGVAIVLAEKDSLTSLNASTWGVPAQKAYIEFQGELQVNINRGMSRVEATKAGLAKNPELADNVTKCKI